MRLQSTQELGAVETACALLDQEVERLTRLVGARERIQGVTTQVRTLLAAVQPLQTRKEQLAQEIQEHEQTRTEQLAEAQRIADEHQARLDQARQAVEEQEALARTLREAAATEQAALEAKTQALEADYTVKRDTAQRAHEAHMRQLQVQIETLEQQVKDAQALRDRLTALRE